MRNQPTLLESLGLSGLIHVWGEPKAGKTLLASMLAAGETRRGHVIWIVTDGKIHSAARLKELIGLGGGSERNVTLINAFGHVEATHAVLTVRERLRSDTRLVVVDPITRVLDMSHVDDVMWGRDLLEEAMPTIAALCSTGDCTAIVTSEVRETPSGVTAVHHDTIRLWASHDLRLVRRPGSTDTDVLDENSHGESRRIFRFNGNGRAKEES